MEKGTIKIEAGKDVVANILIGDKTGIGKIIEDIKNGISNAAAFFNDSKDVSFEIELIYSREEFDKYLGEKTENWVIAHSFENKFIIFSPEKIEEHTNHKKSEFLQIICHETCHILLQRMNPKFSFWMFEGIALNVANQIKKGEVKKENLEYFINECLFKNLSYEKFISHRGYLISYLLMKYFLDNYDKETVIALMKIRYGVDDFSKKEFCKIVNMTEGQIVDLAKKVLENKKA